MIRYFIVTYFLMLLLGSSCVNKYPFDEELSEHNENYANGKPKKRLFWVGDDKQIVETVIYSESGKKEIICRLNKDTGDGFCKNLYEDQSLKLYKVFQSGEPNGPFISFYPSGFVKSSGYLVDNIREGFYYEYSIDGKLSALSFYENGELYLKKEYSLNDSTSLAIRIKAEYPSKWSIDKEGYYITISIPYIDTLLEFQDSLFFRHDVYNEEQIKSEPLPYPRYNETLIRGKAIIPFSKNKTFNETGRTTWYHSGFIYSKKNDGTLDTLCYTDFLKMEQISD